MDPCLVTVEDQEPLRRDFPHRSTNGHPAAALTAPISDIIGDSVSRPGAFPQALSGS
jgi:hypothetical protein